MNRVSFSRPIALLFFLWFCLLFCLNAFRPVHAELLGMVPGRGADVARFANKSVEVGVSRYSDQLQWSVLRYNFKPVKRLAIYVDFSYVESFNLPLDSSQVADFASTGYGGGLIFSIPEKLNRFDVAFKGTFHQSKSGGQVNKLPGASNAQQEHLELDQSQWSAGFVLSPIDPLYENGFSWFANLSYVRAQARTERIGASPLRYSTMVPYRGDSGMATGIGVVQPYKRGSVFAGVDWLSDNALLSAGYRYVF